MLSGCATQWQRYGKNEDFSHHWGKMYQVEKKYTSAGISPRYPEKLLQYIVQPHTKATTEIKEGSALADVAAMNALVSDNTSAIRLGRSLSSKKG